jgi:hypothetical protein
MLKRFRSYKNLILHFKTRTDDSHAIPNLLNGYIFLLSLKIKIMLVRFYVDYRIKPHAPPLEQIPANSVKFLFCNSTPQVGNFYVNLALSKLPYFKVQITRVSNPIH